MKETIIALLSTIWIWLAGLAGVTVRSMQVSPQPVVTILPSPSPRMDYKILQGVPFIAQAPLGKWSDPRQQDGCEEAAALMAVLWATGAQKPSTSAEAEKKVTEISDWEETTYGSYHDTSVRETADRILKGYFKFTNFEVKENITVEDIKKVLYEGAVVIVPANGQALGNPNFTAPGPERHNLLVTGFDPEKRVFYTNDNGTRRGEGCVYNEEVLYNAIRDYPTGDHLPITETKKNMVVVSRGGR